MCQKKLKVSNWRLKSYLFQGFQNALFKPNTSFQKCLPNIACFWIVDDQIVISLKWISIKQKASGCKKSKPCWTQTNKASFSASASIFVLESKVVARSISTKRHCNLTLSHLDLELPSNNQCIMMKLSTATEK